MPQRASRSASRWRVEGGGGGGVRGGGGHHPWVTIRVGVVGPDSGPDPDPAECLR